jgi:hypothetical protein
VPCCAAAWIVAICWGRSRLRRGELGGGVCDRRSRDCRSLRRGGLGTRVRLYRAQHLLDAGEDIGRLGRLGDEIVGAGLAGAAVGGLVLAARDHDHGQLADPLVLGASDEAQQAEAVELRHVEVGEHHDDRAVFLDRLPGGVAVDGLQDHEARSQNAVERGADELRVVHDEYTLLRSVRRVPH